MADAVMLLVKTHAFGDALMCTPAVRELVRDGRTIWALTGPSASPVWERVQGISRVFVAPVPPSGAADGMRLLKWTLGMRGELRGTDSALVFQGSPFIRRWVRFLTSSRVVSCGGNSLGSWETVYPLEPGELAGQAFARVAGVEVSDWRPEFPVKEAEMRWAEKLGLPFPLFAIAPGGGRNPRDTVMEKRWMPERYAELAGRLSSAGIGTVLLGGGDDRAAAAEMARFSSCGLLDMTGRTTWGQTAAILDRCCGFLGADSGTAHLAAARGIPSVVLFGPSSPSALYPEGLIIPVTACVDCSPCYSNSLFPGCRNDRALCMESIEMEDVWPALVRVLDNPPERAE
ncbi:MAG: glycosyltransferase family 9 protein [Candidatus Fermentibacteraceae bacterium]|nr:glycosyltransferase family 9 protein [Candidatus Fermentibacteraceae bacterium]